MKWSIFKPLYTMMVFLTLSFPAKAIDLVPDMLNLQCGGDMGLPTIGIGWQYGRAEHFETELMGGLVPKYSSSSAKAIFTLKENYVPWHIRISTSRFSIEPLTISLFFTYTASDKLWVKQPSRYPPKYYVLPTKIRTNLSLGQRIKFELPNDKAFVKSITAFYELCTCDYYVLSAAGNSSLHLSDFLTLTLGVKIGI